MPKKFKRVLLKLSGESLGESGIDGAMIEAVAREIAAVQKKGVALAIVIGGGNIWRFRDNKKTTLPRQTSDFLGMLATVMNASALAAILRQNKIDAFALSAIPAPEIAEPYSIPRAREILDRGGIVVLAGGTSRPFFTTDTAAALRAIELDCERILKATTVDGVYDSDPRKNKNAKLLAKLSYARAIADRLGVMDATAFALLADNPIPLTVFNFGKKGALTKAAAGAKIGTQVS